MIPFFCLNVFHPFYMYSDQEQIDQLSQENLNILALRLNQMIDQTVRELDPLFDRAYELAYHVRRKPVRKELDLDDESMIGNSKYNPGNAKNKKK